MNKRILQVLRGLEIGGLENVAMDIFRELRAIGVDVDFLVYGEKIGYYENEVINKGGRVFHISPPSSGFIRFYLNVKKIIRMKGSYDIVYSHTYFNSGIVLRAAKMENVCRCVAHCHSSRRNSDSFFLKQIYNSLMRRWVNKYADVLCACSKQAGDNMFGIEEFEKRGVVLPNRIRYEDFEFDMEARMRIRKSIGCSNQRIVIGTVGHLTSAKNHSLLLQIFCHLYKDNNKYLLLIVGDGELRSELEMRTKQLGIEKQVCFLGMRTDIGALLSAFDVFLLTSSHEGLGIVLLEAQANGLPCIGIEGVIAKEAVISSNFRLVSSMNDFTIWKNNIDMALKTGRLNAIEISDSISKLSSDFRQRLFDILDL